MIIISELLLVMLGGGLGAASRYLTNSWAVSRLGIDFPYGTLIVNLFGCLAMGIIMTLLTERFAAPPYLKWLLTVGFLGGLTTFSSFGYETIHLLETNQLAPVFINIAANTIGGLIMAWLGVFIVRFFS